MTDDHRDPVPPVLTPLPETREVEPTLAPLTLASGLAVLAVGLIVHQGAWIILIGGVWALAGGVMWVLAALKETR